MAIRAGKGQAPRSVGCRAPSTRSAVPAAIGLATRGRSVGSSEASASQNATIGAVAAASPAAQAAPKPRCGSVTTTAPSSRAMAAEPSRDPLSTTIAR